MSRMTPNDIAASSRPLSLRRHGLVASLAACALTTAIGLVSLRYALPSRPGAAPIPNALINPVTLSLHAVPAALALIIIPLQLHSGLRARYPRAHRLLGRTYAGLVGVAALAALWIAPAALGGAVSATGFTALALTWIGTTSLGVGAAVKRRIDAHRAWMTRSAALTFSAVTLRLYLPLATVAGVDFVTAYQASAWLCWVPNLLVAEWWLRRGSKTEHHTTGHAH